MTTWIRSSRCSLGDCCAVTFTRDAVGVKDTKRPDLEPLWFTHAEWAAFVAGVKNGEFDPVEVPSGC